jgi:hypothetical protein
MATVTSIDSPEAVGGEAVGVGVGDGTVAVGGEAFVSHGKSDGGFSEYKHTLESIQLASYATLE